MRMITGRQSATVAAQPLALPSTRGGRRAGSAGGSSAPGTRASAPGGGTGAVHAVAGATIVGRPTLATPRRARRPESTSAKTFRGPQRERHQPDYLILLVVVSLGAIGILMVYSTSGVGSFLGRDGDAFAVVGPQVLWGSLGLALMLVAMRVDYRYLRLFSVPMYLGALLLLAVVIAPPIGPFKPIVVGNSARWLEIGALPAMHPAEFAKLALVVYVAHLLAKKGGQASSLLSGTLPFLVVVGPAIALVALEPDLGTTGVLTLTAFTMFFVAGASLWQLALLVPAGAAAVWFYIQSNAYQMERVTTFLDPWKDPLGAGFHTVQGLLALGLGGVTGRGLGESRQAGTLYLPNAQNDYIFAVVGQELGLLGGIVVISLYLFLAYRGLRVALAAPDTFGALVATGITAWLTFQAFINIGVVTALLPITGITLPFVSAGGSSLLVSFAAVGILLSISRETQPRGTWNDADPDRGRWYRRPHLPGAGRHSRASVTPGGR